MKLNGQGCASMKMVCACVCAGECFQIILKRDRDEWNVILLCKKKLPFTRDEVNYNKQSPLPSWERDKEMVMS